MNRYHYYRSLENGRYPGGGEVTRAAGAAVSGQRDSELCYNGQPLAMVYAPYQHFRKLYPAPEALSKGTLFTELYYPFEAKGGKKR